MDAAQGRFQCREGIFGSCSTWIVVNVVHNPCCEQSMAQFWLAHYTFNPKTLADTIGNVY